MYKIKIRFPPAAGIQRNIIVPVNAYFLVSSLGISAYN